MERFKVRLIQILSLWRVKILCKEINIILNPKLTINYPALMPTNQIIKVDISIHTMRLV